MHRRSVQCLAEISSRVASPSKQVNVSESLLNRRHASSQAVGKGKLLSLKSDHLKDVAKLIVRKSSPKARARQKISKTPQDTGRRLRPDVFLPEKTEFLSCREDDPWQSDLDLSEPEAAGKYNISRGTYLEVRRNNAVVHSVAVDVVAHDGRWMILALTTSGEVWPCREDDVQFRIPGFTDKNVVMKVGSEAFTEEPVAVQARIKLLKQMRDFDRLVELRAAELMPRLRTVYDHFKAADPGQWSSVTLSEVAKYVDPKTERPHVSTMFAIHKYLFRKSAHFVPSSSGFLESQKFLLRPQNHIEDAEFVNDLVIRRDHRLEEFAMKAMEYIKKAQKLQEESWNEPPTIQPSTVPGFTEDEARILRFLDHTVRAVKAVQIDPFITQQAGILKKIHVYDELVNTALTQRFMMDLGLLAPWQEQIGREYLTSAETSSQSQKLGADDVSPVVTLASTTSRPLGPQGLYSLDPVESLRHDFSNMPVYVIDDYGAQELDDGISVERVPSEPGNIWLHIHIADPTAVLSPTSDVVKDVSRKLQTVYLLDQTIPMLPDTEPFTSMSLGARSARTGQPEPAMSFSIKVGTDGDILETKVRPSVIKNVHILKYDDVDVALGFPKLKPYSPFGDSPPPRPSQPLEQSVIDDMTGLQEVARRMVKKRYDAGIMAFTVPKATVGLSPTPLPLVPEQFTRPYECRGFPKITYYVQNSLDNVEGSRGMIAEAMKLACRAASRFFAERGLSGIRRAVGPMHLQDESALDRLLSLRSEQGYVDYAACLQAGVVSTGAKYTLRPESHHLLGIPEGEGYMKVTSPLRRFQDMIAHWQIKHALLHPEKPALFPDEWLENVAQEIATRESTLKKISWHQTLWYALKRVERARIERQKGVDSEHYPLDNLTGVVYQPPVKNVTTNAYQGVVYIPALGIKAFLVNLTAEQKYNIGDELPIQLGEIQFGLRTRVDASPRG
ncbi:RNB-domain-containing protein [Obba rivulosa]|uniref:RNB-domain-containing protein n=1 Tax=Obba rivulosa TaxID=1052685 RepID=A0A8E2DRE9_9APHY|nr:RNB-domain-containing protein [Obba rivulosa]